MRWRAPGRGAARILLAGDICPNCANIDAILEVGPDEVFRAVKPFFAAADLSIVQWETPLAEERGCSPIAKSGPNLVCDPRGVRLASALGADVALLANNHVGDQGGEAVLATIRTLEAAGIRTVGAGGDLAAACRPLRVDLGILKLSIVNAAEHEFGTASRTSPGSAPLDIPFIVETIRAERAAGRRVLVALHGGHEYDPFPSPRMAKLFRMFADGGADAVFNCHTHCPEGVEVHGGVPVIYSPGNFYFPLRGEKTPLPTWFIGYLAILGIDENGAFELETIPYRFGLERVAPLEGRDRESFDRYLETLSRPLADMAELERLFDLWSVRHGFNYVRGAMKKSAGAGLDFSDPETVGKFLAFRNTHTCESHCDMLGAFFRLAERGLVPAEPTLAEEIAVLQQGPPLS
ncbi:MAG: CapA family protein [Lentisphaeria bacterium]|nr:CapA family protein [Lentisphaeria bacterium]